MKVLLINICLRPNSDRYILPVGLGYIATSLRNSGVAFDLLDLDKLRPSDEELFELLCKEVYDIYMMGCVVTGYRHVKNISAKIRKINPKALIVVGNSVASSIPDLLLTKTESDIVVFSEGDFTALEIIDAWENNKPFGLVKGIAYLEDGNLIRTPKRDVVKNIDDLPLIDWDLFDVDYYNKRSAILANEPCSIPYSERICMGIPTARGCMFRCSFCYFVFIEDKYRFRSPESIVNEIKKLKNKYGMNYVNFWDELTFPTARHAERVAEVLIEESIGVYWNATVRGDLLRKEKHKHVAEKMKEAGCVGLTYSLEHVNEGILKAMNKRLDIDVFILQNKILDDVGIHSWTNLVIGYPEETVDTINEAMEFCYEHNLYPSTGYLLPLPGTPMYQYAIDNGYISDEEEWLLGVDDRQDLHINLTQMDDETLIRTTTEGLIRINNRLDLGLDNEKLFKTTMKRAMKKVPGWQ